MLNYLRHGKLVLDGFSEEGILEEAEFYNVTHLIGLLKDSIARREQRPAADKKRVYRVLQCQENELTQVRWARVVQVLIFFAKRLFLFPTDGFDNVGRVALRAIN